jgi:hypothetical protein
MLQHINIYDPRLIISLLENSQLPVNGNSLDWATPTNVIHVIDLDRRATPVHVILKQTRFE